MLVDCNITFEDQGKYWHILLHSILIWKEEDVTLHDLADDGLFFLPFYMSCKVHDRTDDTCS